eukprot:scaffold46311_cov18-Tisochrysis_lutea.AAC.2
MDGRQSVNIRRCLVCAPVLFLPGLDEGLRRDAMADLRQAALYTPWALLQVGATPGVFQSTQGPGASSRQDAPSTDSALGALVSGVCPGLLCKAQITSTP